MDDKIVMIGKDLGRWMTRESAVTDAAAQPWREVRAYWEGLRKDGAIPARDTIDPRGIAGALEQVFMVERIAPGLARFRLVGSKIIELVGCDMRGMPLTALFDPDGRRKSGPLLEGVFSGPAILHVDLEAERGVGRPALRAHLLLLPLLSYRGKTDLALGCLALDGPIGRAPRRFAITRSQIESLSPGSACAKSAEPAFAEPATAFVMPRPPRSEGRHLRLVQSSD